MNVLDKLVILAKRMAFLLHENGVERTPSQVFDKFHDDARSLLLSNRASGSVANIVHLLLVNCLSDELCFLMTLEEFKNGLGS